MPPNAKGDSGSLRPIVMSLLSLLAVQFVLGIYVNLDVSFPKAVTVVPMMGDMNVVMDHVGLLLHMALGFVLALTGIAALILAIRTANNKAVWLAGLGLAALILAGIGGMAFVMLGQSNAYSYLMAIGFLVSFSCYFAELSVTA